MVWYQQPAEAALVILRTSADGLTTAEASRRLAEHGPNLLHEGETPDRAGPTGWAIGGPPVIVSAPPALADLDTDHAEALYDKLATSVLRCFTISPTGSFGSCSTRSASTGPSSTRNG